MLARDSTTEAAMDPFQDIFLTVDAGVATLTSIHPRTPSAP